MVAAANENEFELTKVDELLKEWRQGDFVLGEQWFVYRYDSQLPLTDNSKDAAIEGGDLAESEVRGRLDAKSFFPCHHVKFRASTATLTAVLKISSLLFLSVSLTGRSVHHRWR